MKQKTDDREQKTEWLRHGSALILAVVLTTLLAIVGVIFLLSSRVESVATSSIADNEDLTLAVDTVVAQISEELSRDVPGADPNGTYYDYPDSFNPWLASLEPRAGAFYYWPKISDIYRSNANPAEGLLEYLGADANNNWTETAYNNDSVGAYGVRAQIIHESDVVTGAVNAAKTIKLDYGGPADADGDGVSDSRWVVIPDKTSSKGKPIFAAVRVIDNGGMLNVNAGFQFDPNNVNWRLIDGSSQTQINLLSLSNLDQTHTAPGEKESRLLSYRCGSESNDIGLYEQKVVWQYGLPTGAYTPFDISDELVFRYRYILNNDQMTTRIETLWTNAFKSGLEVPAKSISDPCDWFWRIYNSYPLPCPDPCVYDYRHIATIYNLDRVINPFGQKMVNINTAEPNAIRNAIKAGLKDANFIDVDNALASQITANLIDYVDGPDYPASDTRYDPNNDVTVIYDDANIPYFGFEQPGVYISELATSLVRVDGNTVAKSYGIELYKPYISEPIPEPNKWRLIISRDPGNPIPVTWQGNSPFYVILNTDANAPLDVNRVDSNEANDLRVVFVAGDVIWLQRDVNGVGFITVDSRIFPPEANTLPGPNKSESVTYNHQRDISPHKCIRRLWVFSINESPCPSTLGGFNLFVHPDTSVIQAHPANQQFTNVGEFGQLFYNNTYAYGVPLPREGVTEPELRINLADPNLPYQQVFNYLTVMDPTQHTTDPCGIETRIKGRININTAPWFVLAQLPWVSAHTPNGDLARSIVNYRDTIHGPFKNIGELMTDANSSINSIGYYEGEVVPIPTALLTPPDGVGDKFEERDVIFARISNLVTVRSDVFTAYILVRIGSDGPQKRFIAILDRSGVTPAGGKVKILALHPVPEAR